MDTTKTITEQEMKKDNKRQIVNRDAFGRIKSLREPFGVYHGTREQWLNEASNIMAVWINSTIEDGINSKDDKISTRSQAMKPFKPHEVEFACSLLSSGIRLDRELAHCHKMGNTFEIRMGVQLEGTTDYQSARVADILLHEMIHVSTWGDGHGSIFKTLAVACGLTGKMTSTTATPELTERILDEVVYVLGKYPHKLTFDEHEVLIPRTPDGKPILPRGKSGKGSRLLKVECIECGMNFRTTNKWVEVAGGVFSCPICQGACCLEY